MPRPSAQGFAAFVFSLCLSLAAAQGTGQSLQPARIVSMNVCTDQLLLLLVERERLASLSYFAFDPSRSNLVELARDIPANRGQADEVLALAPDLIVTSAFSATFAASVLERLQQRVERLGFAANRDEVYAQIRTMAVWTGDRARGEDLIATTQASIEADITRLDAVMAGRKAVYLSSNGIAFGDNSLQHDFIISLGMENIAATAGLSGPTMLSLETLVAAQPDVIFSEPRGALDRQLAHPLLQHPALANPATLRIAVRDRWFDCAGPWLADAYRITAQQVLDP